MLGKHGRRGDLGSLCNQGSVARLHAVLKFTENLRKVQNLETLCRHLDWMQVCIILCVKPAKNLATDWFSLKYVGFIQGRYKGDQTGFSGHYLAVT